MAEEALTQRGAEWHTRAAVTVLARQGTGLASVAPKVSYKWRWGRLKFHEP